MGSDGWRTTDLENAKSHFKSTLVKYPITSQNMEKNMRSPLTIHLHILGRSCVWKTIGTQILSSMVLAKDIWLHLRLSFLKVPSCNCHTDCCRTYYACESFMDTPTNSWLNWFQPGPTAKDLRSTPLLWDPTKKGQGILNKGIPEFEISFTSTILRLNKTWCWYGSLLCPHVIPLLEGILFQTKSHWKANNAPTRRP